jgi:hypothetical protein
LWFGPFVLATLYFVEGHIIGLAVGLAILAYERWSWLALLSPAAAMCLAALIYSMWLPVHGLIYTFSVATSTERSGWRYWEIALTAVFTFLLPFVTDAITWLTFPFPISDGGFFVVRLIPWPTGRYGKY